MKIGAQELGHEVAEPESVFAQSVDFYGMAYMSSRGEMKMSLREMTFCIQYFADMAQVFSLTFSCRRCFNSFSSR